MHHPYEIMKMYAVFENTFPMRIMKISTILKAPTIWKQWKYVQYWIHHSYENNENMLAIDCIIHMKIMRMHTIFENTFPMRIMRICTVLKAPLLWYLMNLMLLKAYCFETSHYYMKSKWKCHFMKIWSSYNYWNNEKGLIHKTRPLWQ